jgi:hypothetical protein
MLGLKWFSDFPVASSMRRSSFQFIVCLHSLGMQLMLDFSDVEPM